MYSGAGNGVVLPCMALLCAAIFCNPRSFFLVPGKVLYCRVKWRFALRRVALLRRAIQGSRLPLLEIKGQIFIFAK